MVATGRLPLVLVLVAGAGGSTAAGVVFAASQVCAASTTGSLLSCGMVPMAGNIWSGVRALRERLAGAVGVDGGGEVEFGAIIHLEGLHGSGFAGCVGPEKAGIGASMKGNGDGFCGACRAAIDRTATGADWVMRTGASSRVSETVSRPAGLRVPVLPSW